MRVLSVFVSLRRLYAHDNFVWVNLFDGTFLARPINEDPVASFQHRRCFPYAINSLGMCSRTFSSNLSLTAFSVETLLFANKRGTGR